MARFTDIDGDTVHLCDTHYNRLDDDLKDQLIFEDDSDECGACEVECEKLHYELEDDEW